MLRRFILLRVEDVSGSSGTGVVARGVVGPNGWTVMFWEDSMKFFPNVEAMMKVHAHEGRTRFHWQDPPPEADDPIRPSQSFRTEEQFQIAGRGTVHVVKSPAGMKPPKPGDIIRLDLRLFEVSGVERQAIPEEALQSRACTVGLMGKFLDIDLPKPQRVWKPCPPPKKTGLYLLRKTPDDPKPVVVFIHPDPEKVIVEVAQDIIESAEEEEWSPETIDDALRETQEDYAHWTVEFGPGPGEENYFSVDEISNGEWSPLRQ